MMVAMSYELEYLAVSGQKTEQRMSVAEIVTRMYRIKHEYLKDER